VSATSALYANKACASAAAPGACLSSLLAPHLTILPYLAFFSVLCRFQGDPPTTVFLLSMRSGSVGINLTAASHVFLMVRCCLAALHSLHCHIFASAAQAGTSVLCAAAGRCG